MSSRCLNQRLMLILFFLLGMNMLTRLSWSSAVQEKLQTIETVHKKDRALRSHAKVSIQQHPQDHERYVMAIEGQGEYGGYKDVHWLSEAEIEEKDNRIRILKTFIKVLSKEKIVFSSLKQFDYINQLVTIEIRKENKTEPSKYSFPIKGPICDDITMVYFFNKIILLQDPVVTPRFFLLTNEPKLYDVMVKPRGIENIKLPSGEYTTEKFQLMADLGPLTDLASKMVPPTYVWFPKDNREHWIQYEGMETGYETANIVSYVLKD